MGVNRSSFERISGFPGQTGVISNRKLKLIHAMPVLGLNENTEVARRSKGESYFAFNFIMALKKSLF